MDTNNQNGTNNNLATTENKIWLPPSYTNKAPLANRQALTQKNIDNKWRWGFAKKTGWEWLNLIGILLVPLMIGILTIANNIQQSQISQQQYTNSQTISLDQQQEIALATYLDSMTNLMLKSNLLQSKPNDEVSIVARVQTLTVLRRINPNRKDIVLRFLFEAGLIPIIRLDDANLSEVREISKRPTGAVTIKDLMLQYAILTHSYLVNLRIEQGSLYYTDMSFSTFIHMIVTFSNFNYANLNGINIFDSDLSNSSLVGTDLSSAILNNVNLRNTDFSNANLSGATLIKVDLRGAKITSKQLAQVKSLRGATMPDGTMHP